MANYWARKGWHVTLITLDDGRTPSFYALDQRIRLFPLGTVRSSTHMGAALQNNVLTLVRLRHAIVQSAPDVVISFMHRTNIRTLLATRGLPTPAVVSDRSAALEESQKLWKFLQRWSYRWADLLVVQSRAYVQQHPPAVQRHTVVIPNPVLIYTEQPAVGDEAASPFSPPLLITLGRLSKVKGFDRLLQAFARIAAHHPTWSLVIWGEGDERANLEALRHSLGLDERVHMPGLTTNPLQKLRQADMFVLSSHTEGFPMALCEAMACGLPVVSFDCPSGPRDIIRDGVDGVLVPHLDVDALAAALDRLMQDEQERKRLAARAPEVLERFGLEKTMNLWEEHLARVCHRG